MHTDLSASGIEQAGDLAVNEYRFRRYLRAGVVVRVDRPVVRRRQAAPAAPV